MDHGSTKSSLSCAAKKYICDEERESYRATIATALVDETLERVLVFLGEKIHNETAHGGYTVKIGVERDDGDERALMMKSASRSSALEPATEDVAIVVNSASSSAKLMHSPVECKSQKMRAPKAHSRRTTSASTASGNASSTHDQKRLRQLTRRLVNEEEEERVLLYLMEDRAQRETKNDEKRKRRRVGAAESLKNRYHRLSLPSANELEQRPLALERPPAGSVMVALEGRLAIAACQSLQRDTAQENTRIHKRITSAEENETKSLGESSDDRSSDQGERRKHEAAVLFIQRVGKGYLLRRGPCGMVSVGSKQNNFSASEEEEALESAKPLPLFVRSERNNESKTEDRPAALMDLSQADPIEQAEGDPIGRVRRKLAAHRRAAFPSLTPHPEFSPHTCKVNDKKPSSPPRPHHSYPAFSFLATHVNSTGKGSPTSGSPPALINVPPIPTALSPYRNPRLAPIPTSFSKSVANTGYGVPPAGRPHSPSSSLSVYSKEDGLVIDAIANAGLVITYDRKAASDVAAKERRERERRLAKVQLSAASSHMKEAIDASKKYEAMKKRREEHAREWATIRERAKVEARRGAAEEKKKQAAEEASRMRELDQREIEEVETHIALRMRVLGESRLVALKKTLVEVPGAARVSSMSPSLSLSKAERGSQLKSHSSPARTHSL